MPAPVPATDAAPPACSALAAGLWRCRGCAAVCLPPPQARELGRTRCPRCDAVVYPRLPGSVARSWAFLLAGTALYLPANLLPVTSTSSIGGRQYDTIFSGIVYFWKDGSYGLAALVFGGGRGVAGSIDPARKGSKLTVEKRDRHGRWRRAASGTVGDGGRYRLALQHPGTYRVKSGGVAGPAVHVH